MVVGSAASIVFQIVYSYSYLGIDFSSKGAWDMHIKKLLDNGKKKYLISCIKLLVTRK